MAEDASSFVMKKEILGVDFLRFLAALMVLAFHVGFWGFHAPPQVLDAMLGSADIGNILEPYTKFGWVGVEIFFVISGFIIAYSAEGATPASFFRGRLLRLMPCVWFACLMCIPMAYFIEQYPVALIIKLLVKSMLLYPKGPWIEAVLWTLVVEVAFYAVIFLLIFKNWLKHIDLVGGLIGLSSACYWILEGLMLRSPRYAALARQMGDFSWSPAAQVSLIHHGCFFGIGIGLWLLLIKRRLGITVVLAPVLLVGSYYEILHTGFTEFQATAIAQSSIVPFAVWCLFHAMVNSVST